MMKAITLHQPWASLIAEGIKTTETRTWAPPGWLLGSRIAIHAAKRSPSKMIAISDPESGRYGFVVPKVMPAGKIVATARLVSAGQVMRHATDGTEAHLRTVSVLACREWDVPIDPYGDYAVGRWIWFLDDIRKLDKPIPARGMQRLWNLPPEIADAIE